MILTPRCTAIFIVSLFLCFNTQIQAENADSDSSSHDSEISVTEDDEHIDENADHSNEDDLNNKDNQCSKDDEPNESETSQDDDEDNDKDKDENPVLPETPPLLRSTSMKLITYVNATETQNERESRIEQEKRSKALKESLNELRSLTGLQSVKDSILDILSSFQFNNARDYYGLPQVPQSLNFVFMGNPGTGKTTVARILAKILYAYGVVSNDAFFELSRGDLVKGFIGQTETHFKELMKEAQGGVVFIDEVYALKTDENSGKDFGTHVINGITQQMTAKENEDPSTRVVFIFAGYKKEVQRFFLEANPGLASRIQYKIDFPDYDADELMVIFENLTDRYQFSIEGEAKEFLRKALKQCKSVEGNARFVRNLYQYLVDYISRKSYRVTLDEELDDDKVADILQPNFDSMSAQSLQEIDIDTIKKALASAGFMFGSNQRLIENSKIKSYFYPSDK